VVERFKPALRTAGAGPRGRNVFLARCAACHRLNGEGQEVGPDLDWVKPQGKEKLLMKMLEPNLDLAPNQAPRVAETFTGRYFVGNVLDENPTTLTLNQSDGVSVVLPRSNLRALQVQSWSLMPEGLEQGLSVQDLADLLEYIIPGK
jgi:putative heme-binding domain-containing protein